MEMLSDMDEVLFELCDCRAGETCRWHKMLSTTKDHLPIYKNMVAELDQRHAEYQEWLVKQQQAESLADVNE